MPIPQMCPGATPCANIYSCIQCTQCVETCLYLFPNNAAITIAPDGFPNVNPPKCLENIESNQNKMCGECIGSCPTASMAWSA